MVISSITVRLWQHVSLPISYLNISRRANGVNKPYEVPLLPYPRFLATAKVHGPRRSSSHIPFPVPVPRRDLRGRSPAAASTDHQAPLAQTVEALGVDELGQRWDGAGRSA